MPDLATAGRWAPLPLRLIVGYGFIAHGFAKLSRGPDAFAVTLHTLGIPLPLVFSWLTTLVELIGGTAILSRSARPAPASGRSATKSSSCTSPASPRWWPAAPARCRSTNGASGE